MRTLWIKVAAWTPRARRARRRAAILAAAAVQRKEYLKAVRMINMAAGLYDERRNRPWI